MSVAEKVLEVDADLQSGRYPEKVHSSMREFIDWLKETDELVVVTEEVDPRNFE